MLTKIQLKNYDYRIRKSTNFNSLTFISGCYGADRCLISDIVKAYVETPFLHGSELIEGDFIINYFFNDRLEFVIADIDGNYKTEVIHPDRNKPFPRVSVYNPERTWDSVEDWYIPYNDDSITILSYPEAKFLTPREQTELGIHLAVLSNEAQIVIETYSPFILDGIRIAVKEGKLDASKTTFNHFDINTEGVYNIECPKLGARGKFDYWPKGFFTQTMNNKAVLARV